jgi:hypothetical protein
MLTTLFTILLTFALTGLLGNFIVQTWQQQNWLRQRRIMEVEAQYTALQTTFNEVSELAGRRQHRMFRLLSSLGKDDDDVVQKRAADYDESSAQWNERLVAQYAKLTMQFESGYRLATRLEEDIQPRFVAIDTELSRLLGARRRSGAKVSKKDFARLSQNLNALQGKIGLFSKVTLKEIADQKKGLYQPRRFTPYTLDSFPTWELFKALFKSRQRHLDEL